jgi:hypothetical protein
MTQNECECYTAGAHGRLVFPETAEPKAKSHLASAIPQDQGKRLMFEPPSELDVTRNWALAFSPGIVIVATTWWL